MKAAGTLVLWPIAPAAAVDRLAPRLKLAV
jgi:hypothetical protein